MSELEPQITTEAETVKSGSLDIIAQNYARAADNANRLRAILHGEDTFKSIKVECVSSAIDIGGFYIDEESSDPRYRDFIRVGSKNGGDSLEGSAVRLRKHVVNSKPELQLEVNLGNIDTNSPDAIIYFKLEPTLFGCTIS